MSQTLLALSPRFLRFGLVGLGGLMVDVGVLSLVMTTGLGPYTARLVSFFAAVTFTWYANRTFTFGVSGRRNLLKEWLAFVSVNSVGGLVNYGVYSLLVAFTATVAAYPVLGVVAGSLAGMIFNYTGSSRVVFRARPAPSGTEPDRRDDDSPQPRP